MTFMKKWRTVLGFTILLVILFALKRLILGTGGMLIGYSLVLIYFISLLVWVSKTKAKIYKYQKQIILNSTYFILSPISLIFIEDLHSILEQFSYFTAVFSSFFIIIIIVTNVSFFFILGCMLIALLCEFSITFPINRELKTKGYDWISWYQTLLLHREVGNAIKHLPNYEELTVIPGINKNDFCSLIAVIQYLPIRFQNTKNKYSYANYFEI